MESNTTIVELLLSTTAQLRRSVLNDCVKFNIFGSVHAMKTEIPPFDSEIKAKIQLIPPYSYSHYQHCSDLWAFEFKQKQNKK
jgi:hypothetical protein